ncbi:MAG: hypothetical protein PHE29_09770 [Tissierellia bacterium]|nr:hypothetical protein [Tissierellia bacterium]
MGNTIEFNQKSYNSFFYYYIQSNLKKTDFSIDVNEKIKEYSMLIRELMLEGKTTNYTNKDLREALPPIVSIINKTTKAQSKYEKGSSQFKRFKHIIQAMLISKTIIGSQINVGS